MEAFFRISHSGLGFRFQEEPSGTSTLRGIVLHASARWNFIAFHGVHYLE